MLTCPCWPSSRNRRSRIWPPWLMSCELRKLLRQLLELVEQQNPGTGLYNKPRIFRIHGKVDSYAMQRSLNKLRQRHEILRVRFVAGVNGPAQVVMEGGSFPFAVTD